MDTNSDDFPVDTMDRPAKRACLSFSSDPVEGVPEQWDLQAARAQNDLKLKSIFERIFSKYGKDFTEIGDEIDLQTGKIVVDNGHLLGLREETDAGESQPWLYEDEDADSKNGEDPEELPVQAHEPSTNERDGIHGESDPEGDSLLDSGLIYNDAGSTENPKKRAWEEIQDPGPIDPIWQAPELPRLLSTPTGVKHKVATPRLPSFIREPSPPGSGSVWTVPRRGRPPGRPRPHTEVKPQASPSKVRTRVERTYQSSPVAHGWSFSQIPDGDESDDPLQEDQPSPTPSKLSVRGKRISRPLFTSNRYLRPSTQEVVPRDQSAATDSDSESEPLEQNDTQDNVALDTVLQSSAARPQPKSASKPRTNTEPRYKMPKESYSSITPDEARLIIRLRHVQRKEFKEIKDFLPDRKMMQIYHWDYHHWTRTRLDPPRLSASWTKGELDILQKLKDKTGLLWPDIKAKVPGRSRKEIEYELMRLWVGDEVWNDEEWNDNVEGEDVTGLSSRPRKRPLDTGTPEVDPEDGKTSRSFEMIIDDDSDTFKSDASSDIFLSAIDLNSPAYSRQGSRTPSRATPAKRLKLTT